MEKTQQYVKELMIDPELEWYQKKLLQYQGYIDSIDLANLTDRIEWKPTSKGGVMPMVIASKEGQAKSFGENMEKYGKLLNIVDSLRNKYAEKTFLGRGKVETKGTAIDFMSKMKNKPKE